MVHSSALVTTHSLAADSRTIQALRASIKLTGGGSACVAIHNLEHSDMHRQGQACEVVGTLCTASFCQLLQHGLSVS